MEHTMMLIHMKPFPEDQIKVMYLVMNSGENEIKLKHWAGLKVNLMNI